MSSFQPLDQKFPIVDARGNPSEYFIRWAQQRQLDIGGALTEAGLTQYLTDHKLSNAQEILDQISAVRGSVLYRGATAWSVLIPGAAGQFLKTNGAGADPAWATASGGAGDWWKVFTPTAATFPTLFKLAGDTNPVMTDDTDLGLTMFAGFPGGDRWKGYGKTLPLAVNWWVKARITFNFIPKNYAGISLCAVDTTPVPNKLRALGYMFDGGYRLNHTNWLTSAFNSHLGNFPGGKESIFVMFNYIVATNILEGWISVDGKHWWFHSSQNVDAWFGVGNKPKIVGIGIYTTFAAAAGFEQGGVCDYWQQSF